jgi:hypothetical protein
MNDKPAIHVRVELDVEPSAIEAVRSIVSDVKSIADKAEKLGPLAGLVEKLFGKKGDK